MRQQDDELDELSASVQRIGGVGLTIHEELSGQERILNNLCLEMETTSNRLDFVQKRVATVMKKASIKGQIMLILFLVVLFIILFFGVLDIAYCTDRQLVRHLLTIAVALLNARMSVKSFNRWSVPLGFPLVSLMLSKLSLVIPLSTIQAVRFQLLHTPPQKIHFAGDLKYGPHVGHFYHMLVEMWPINPLAVKQGELAPTIHSETALYTKDLVMWPIGGWLFTAEEQELQLIHPFYRLLMPMLFLVLGEVELLEVLQELLSDSKALEARQRAAKDAFSIMSDGVVNRVWKLVCTFAINS